MSTEGRLEDEFRRDWNQASLKQVEFIESLIDQINDEGFSHQCHENGFGDDVAEFRDWLKDQARFQTSKTKASAWIDRLKVLKAAHPVVAVQSNVAVPPVPDGRFAIEIDGTLKFYKVKNGHSRVFVDVQASDDWHPLTRDETRKRVLASIAADPRAAAIRYGHELGKCGICGRTLTDETSRANGIGPICADKVGF